MGSIKKAFDLTGKNALVTGGSRGLGLQIAEALGEQGARVVISSRKAQDLEKAQAHLAGLGIKSDWIAADNSRDEDVKRQITQLAKDWLPKPNILHPWPGIRFAVTHPRWEPYAGKPHVRFCAGGA
jgi:NAD(P)-dependent dehydrogenase (short-subunit alcohol dehydrogenase family)